MTPGQLNEAEMKQMAFEVRKHIINMSTNGGCFIGASLSAVDIMVTLYTQFLKIPSVTSEERDFFYLSKGHDVPALYGTLAELGFIERERLKHHLSTTDSIYWHPNRAIPGVEFYSGSLGHLISVGMGVAFDLKMRKKGNRVVVLVGDGELNEGSNWEALLVAKAHKLDNLFIIVDRNQFQANVATEDLIPLEPLDEKFRAFGAAVKTIDGHDFLALKAGLDQFPYQPTGPSVLIAKTIRGKGLPSIEARADRWFCNFSQAEIATLLQELESGVKTELTSETLMVR